MTLSLAINQTGATCMNGTMTNHGAHHNATESGSFELFKFHDFYLETILVFSKFNFDMILFQFCVILFVVNIKFLISLAFILERKIRNNR